MLLTSAEFFRNSQNWIGAILFVCDVTPSADKINVFFSCSKNLMGLLWLWFSIDFDWMEYDAISYKGSTTCEIEDKELLLSSINDLLSCKVKVKIIRINFNGFESFGKFGSTVLTLIFFFQWVKRFILQNKKKTLVKAFVLQKNPSTRKAVHFLAKIFIIWQFWLNYFIVKFLVWNRLNPLKRW